ncbi:Tim44/TimA family putative adaptor protein [Candidatus Endowatersipora endosymbiont of Watersipora subatra]|uniref:Tim44/TimA family putative adaptor protein n=1 Tax=Candidatus Endowatersipora endosymbiont of Watersipora subatra TaxID=3077946 RepID=UPI00312C896E
MELDPFTIFPLAVAIFVFWKLRSVLGSRNRNEHLPYDPHSSVKNDSDLERSRINDNSRKFIGIRRHRLTHEQIQSLTEVRIQEVSGQDRNLEQGLKAITLHDRNFDIDQFVEGAKKAYELIVMSFANGNKKKLEGLLSSEVFENFETVINDRASRGERVQSSFVRIESARITAAELLKDEAQISLEFVSQIISATLNEREEIIEGSLEEIIEVTDIWTFTRSVKSNNPNWKVVATDK